MSLKSVVHFRKGVLWNCEKDEIDLCAAVEEYTKITE